MEQNKEIKQTTFKYAFLRSLPVMAGYIVIGFGFGILIANKGYSFWWALFMSAGIYAGSLQYVGLELLSNSASFISVALISFLINARHIFYGISMLEKYKDTGKIKPLIVATLTDETYSLVCVDKFPDYIEKNRYYLYISLLNYSYWIIGSLMGAIIGNSFAFNTNGVEFAMTALFVVVFIEQWKNTKEHLPAILGLGVSILCLLIFGKNNFLIPTMFIIPILLLIFEKKIEKKLEVESFSEKEEE